MGVIKNTDFNWDNAYNKNYFWLKNEFLSQLSVGIWCLRTKMVFNFSKIINSFVKLTKIFNLVYNSYLLK